LRGEGQILAQQLNRERLVKVLALADSNQDGEAMAAIRTAKSLMSHSGLSFKDLLYQMPEPNGWLETENNVTKASPDLSALRNLLRQKTKEAEEYSDVIRELHQQISVLQSALDKKSNEATGWKDRAWKILWENDEDLMQSKKD